MREKRSSAFNEILKINVENYYFLIEFLSKIALLIFFRTQREFTLSVTRTTLFV